MTKDTPTNPREDIYYLPTSANKNQKRKEISEEIR